MLTLLDIQNKNFKRVIRGYSTNEVDQFLSQLANSCESAYLENQIVKEKLELTEVALARYKDMEKMIKDTMIISQKNAEEIKRSAQHEAEVMLEEARVRAEKILAEAGEKAARIMNDAREQAWCRTKEADEKARSILDEYRFMEMQNQVFRMKLRAFLEAQLSLLEGQEEEARETMLNAGLNVIEAAAGIEASATPTQKQACDEYKDELAGDEVPEQKESGQ